MTDKKILYGFKQINPEMLSLARCSRGLSQLQLIKLGIGVSQPTYDKYERVESHPSIEVLSNIANKLNYPISLFYEEGKWSCPISLHYGDGE